MGKDGQWLEDSRHSADGDNDQGNKGVREGVGSELLIRFLEGSDASGATRERIGQDPTQPRTPSCPALAR